MRLLLDTHVILWTLGGDRALSGEATDAVRRADQLYVGAVTLAEIGVKCALGRLSVPQDLVRVVVESGMRLLPLQPDHGLAVAGLPLVHRNPFDRLLVAQAAAEGLTLVTADRRIRGYDVPTAPA